MVTRKDGGNLHTAKALLSPPPALGACLNSDLPEWGLNREEDL